MFTNSLLVHLFLIAKLDVCEKSVDESEGKLAKLFLLLDRVEIQLTNSSCAISPFIQPR